MEKDKALDAALSQIERAFGKGSIMRLGQNSHIDIEAISTGSLGIDIALGIGGMPKGRIIEIYGPESSGKTTLALSVIAQAQKKGGTCAFIDAEHALDPGYAKKIGVDIENLLISQPKFQNVHTNPDPKHFLLILAEGAVSQLFYFPAYDIFTLLT